MTAQGKGDPKSMKKKKHLAIIMFRLKCEGFDQIEDQSPEPSGKGQAGFFLILHYKKSAEYHKCQINLEIN